MNNEVEGFSQKVRRWDGRVDGEVYLVLGLKEETKESKKDVARSDRYMENGVK